MSKYFDHAATHPISPKVKELLSSYDSWYNPSSSYQEAVDNMAEIEFIRRKVANYIHADPEEIIFTSGGSEANALALNIEDLVFCSAIEHSSILENPKTYGNIINVRRNGVLDLNDLIEKIKIENTPEEFMVSVQYVNNEIGTVQPIKRIAEIVHANYGILHCDMVQALGHIPISVKLLDVDMASFSGHKIGSLKGIGFLYVKKELLSRIKPIIYGIQEQGLRGGTYNDLAIRSLGVAIDDFDYDGNFIKNRRNCMLERLVEECGCILNGEIDYMNRTTINVQVPDVSINSQQIVNLMDMEGFKISAGSACHSYSSKPSHVLKAIGLTDEEANSSIRISIGIDNSYGDIDSFVESLKNIIKINKL